MEDLVWESAELITLRGDYSPVVVLFCLNALFICKCRSFISFRRDLTLVQRWLLMFLLKEKLKSIAGEDTECGTL